MGDCFCLVERDTLGIEYFDLKKQQHLLVAEVCTSGLQLLSGATRPQQNGTVPGNRGQAAPGWAGQAPARVQEARVQDSPAARTLAAPLPGVVTELQNQPASSLMTGLEDGSTEKHFRGKGDPSLMSRVNSSGENQKGL